MKEQKKEEKTFTPGPMLFWVISGKNAYQTFLMVYLAIACVPLLMGQIDSNNPVASLNPWINTAFAGGLILSCIMNLAGVYWRGSLMTGLRLELFASVLMSLTSLAYGVVVLLLVSPVSSVALTCIILGLLTIAGVARAWQIISAYRQVLSFKKEIASLTELG